ncbi:hypothetical protein RFI_01118 [Reticulomyxa filosa]|uniref:Uncharacterized protein n=1 Tax=Reticulomyxa filosa TaxID=46433 RepID=X6PCX3_RETFI|nr:hypothetical protein RFI_01118 [Reticulomyxa filosa]|eukprot:ETO35943.1 hypothetical protein RFI_01118 [Reticulomyxa filosa]
MDKDNTHIQTRHKFDHENSMQSDTGDLEQHVHYQVRRESASHSQNTENESRDDEEDNRFEQNVETGAKRRPLVTFAEPFETVISSKERPSFTSPLHNNDIENQTPSVAMNAEYINATNGNGHLFHANRRTSRIKKKWPMSTQQGMSLTNVTIPEHEAAAHNELTENHGLNKFPHVNDEHQPHETPHWKTNSFTINLHRLNDPSLDISENDHTRSGTHTNSLLQGPLILSARAPPKEPPSLVLRFCSFFFFIFLFFFVIFVIFFVLTQELTSNDLTDIHQRDIADVPARLAQEHAGMQLKVDSL